MEDQRSRNQHGDVFSTIIKAGKRTYFFDVKSTKSDEKFLTITESKRKYDDDQEKFFYEKHKIFLYREDFENFVQGLKNAIEFIDREDGPCEPRAVSNSPMDFEDLDQDK